jgi:hypothetical protein
MAAVTPLDTIMNSLLSKSRKKLVMAYVKSNALVAWFFANERIEFEDGGRDITNPLIVGRNPNVAAYAYYGNVPTAQTNEFATVGYGWSRVAGTVIISDQEQDENKGEALIFKLLKAKMEVLDTSIQEKFSGYMYGSGPGVDPYGLEAAIPDDPTTGSFGGRDRAANNDWRTSSYDFAGGLTSTNIEEAFDDILLDLTVKKERPSVIIAGRDIYRTYRQAVRDKLVINLSEIKKAVVDLGFKGIAHDNIPIIYDEDCASNKCYFINDTYLRLHILRGVNMKIKELTAPWNVDAVGRRVIWQGQLCQWKAFRTHAVVIA